MQPTFKELEINGTKYQVTQFTARTGSWVLLQVITKILPSMAGEALNGSTGSPNRPLMTEDEFQALQAHCLHACRRVENGMPMPVFFYPNRWAIPELEYDLLTVMTLTAHCLVYNLAPFFEKGGMNQLTSVMQDLNPQTLPQ